MSNEFLTRNRLSSLSNDSHSNRNHQSNHSHSNENVHGQSVIGQDFASNILVADLAIQSTSYMQPQQRQTPPLSPVNRSVTPNMDNKKANRRVTFKEVVDIDIISCYDSFSSSSDMSLDSDDNEEESDSESNSEELPPSAPTPSSSTSALPERISKRASYDALQHRMQIRRYQKIPTNMSKPGYWYPLSPSSISLNGGLIRHGATPLPTLPSLEMTERLINEFIQRETALNPNLLQFSRNSTREPSLHALPTMPMTTNNDAASMLITDTVDDAEYEHTDEETEEFDDTRENDNYSESSVEEEASIAEQGIDHVIENITLVHINDQQPNTRQSASSFSSIYIEDEEESDTSVATASPQPQPDELFRQQSPENEDIQESDFARSIFNELARRHKQTIVPYPEHQPPQLMFPFEQNLVPIDNVVFIPPPQPIQINNDPVCIDTPFSTDQPTPNTRELFFVKVLKVENLDFPIDGNIDLYCSIRYKNSESISGKQKMTHTMTINHEMRIENVDRNEQIAITIHAAASSSGWYHRIKPTSDLERYVYKKDGSICQTLFLPKLFIADNSLDQTASLMLVNNWYKTSLRNTSNPSLLRLKKGPSFKKNNSNSPGKAVGKVYIQCLYAKTRGNYVPTSMEEALEALHASRFHQTDWQTGYMSQMGGNTTCLTRRFFTLTGGCLFAYENEFAQDKRQALYKLPLSRAVKLICDNLVIAEKPRKHQRKKSPTTLLSQLESVIMMSDDDDDREATGNIPQDSFYLVFDNGEKIQFQCQSTEERSRWVSFIEVMMCKLPELPDWIMT